MHLCPHRVPKPDDPNQFRCCGAEATIVVVLTVPWLHDIARAREVGRLPALPAGVVGRLGTFLAVCVEHGKRMTS